MTAQPDLTATGRAALAYAAKGFVLVPLHGIERGRCTCPLATCPSPGKHPRPSRGLREASADAAQVRQWWMQWPTANVGCLPGPSGYVVLDIDGPEGEATAEGLGLLAEPTLEVVTGRGRHRWYRHPGGHIPNGQLGPKLDVRGDAGYVLLPPSMHVSGTRYRWAGRLEDVAALPLTLVPRLQGQADRSAPPPDRLPAWMLPFLTVQQGGRNQTMTRFVGWALAQGHDIATVQAMADGLNAKWPEPLPSAEVEAVVRSIAAAEARKPARLTSTGTTLQLAAPVVEPEVPTLPALRQVQRDEAITRGRQDFTNAPRWRWADLDRLMGPLLPGEVHMVGAITGNGKTAFLMSQMEGWAERQVPVLYIPLELDPSDLRRQWAAWQLGLPWVNVARNDWAGLPEGSQDAHEAMVAEQAENPFVHFPPDRRITIARLAQWVGRAVDEAGVKVVVVDHFHRMDFGPATSNYRVQVTEAARALRDVAREHSVVVVAAAQLNQDPHPLDRYFPPTLKRLKESSGISEEASTVLMLSRVLKESVTPESLQLLREGLKETRDFEEPNTMSVTCRKSRLDDTARDRAVKLAVAAGRVIDYLPPGLARSWADRYGL